MTQRAWKVPWPVTGIAAAALGLAACDPAPEQETARIESEGSVSPPYPGEGAAGFVGVDDAGAGENPITPALPGGPAGQTPDYPQPGYAPSVVYSDRPRPVRSPPDTAALPNVARDEDTPAH